MKHRFTSLASLFGAIALFFTTNCSMEAKKPVLKNTKWVCVKEMFVADVGTSTETYTLEFTSAKECTYTMSWYTPAHPAMYVNPDGTIDTYPARSSEQVSKGTWTYKRGKLTVTLEDGSAKVFTYKDGKLFGEPYFDGSDMAFEKSTD